MFRHSYSSLSQSLTSSICPCLLNTIPKYLNSFTTSILAFSNTTISLLSCIYWYTHPVQISDVNYLYSFPHKHNYFIFPHIQFVSFYYTHYEADLPLPFTLYQQRCHPQADTQPLTNPLLLSSALLLFLPTLAFTSLIHPSIKILNNHGDITHPCLIQTKAVSSPQNH